MTTKMNEDAPRPAPLYGDRLNVPMRAESEDGSIVGSGVREIGPDDPDYDRELAWVQEFGPRD
jgi:hypothetical protein